MNLDKIARDPQINAAWLNQVVAVIEEALQGRRYRPLAVHRDFTRARAAKTAAGRRLLAVEDAVVQPFLADVLDKLDAEAAEEARVDARTAWFAARVGTLDETGLDRLGAVLEMSQAAFYDEPQAWTDDDRKALVSRLLDVLAAGGAGGTQVTGSEDD